MFLAYKNIHAYLLIYAEIHAFNKEPRDFVCILSEAPVIIICIFAFS